MKTRIYAAPAFKGLSQLDLSKYHKLTNVRKLLFLEQTIFDQEFMTFSGGDRG